MAKTKQVKDLKKHDSTYLEIFGFDKDKKERKPKERRTRKEKIKNKRVEKQ